jgi:hypothetical protein
MNLWMFGCSDSDGFILMTIYVCYMMVNLVCYTWMQFFMISPMPTWFDFSWSAKLDFSLAQSIITSVPLMFVLSGPRQRGHFCRIHATSRAPAVGDLHAKAPPCPLLATCMWSPHPAMLWWLRLDKLVAHHFFSDVCLIAMSSKQKNIFLFPVQAGKKKIEGQRV